ncbi:MAG: hypothetical protein DBY41_08465 [Clostridium sp.]|uniref:hypothetical protein n=1 Tax=Intestinibacter bartlettii TaxID=261299 RepID=UPI000D793045|nr:hypothetical protein [Intestinibacter bartlettii]MDU2694237.1 hypothetical protein [Intestinibacter bartlettii]PWM78454.1 MAG: hypothetical protein DBY41_08465 [Clostridium sp.]
MDKIEKEIRVRFYEDDFWLYDWVADKFASNNSFIKDILRKEYAKEQVEIYGICDLVSPPGNIVVTSQTKKQEDETDFDIDDLED